MAKNLTEGKMCKGGQNPPIEADAVRPPAPRGSGVKPDRFPIEVIEEIQEREELLQRAEAAERQRDAMLAECEQFIEEPGWHCAAKNAAIAIRDAAKAAEKGGA